MIKFLPILLSMFYLSAPQILNTSIHRSGDYYHFVKQADDTYYVDSIIDDSLNEYRLYSKYEIDGETIIVGSVNLDLLFDIDHDFIIMISKDISGINHDFLINTHITRINYTGSEEDWNNLGIGTFNNLYFYENDEGFINYWNDKVRPDGEVDVCSMSIDDYILLKDKYDLLVAEDKAYVNDYIDKAEQSIEDTMDYLSKYFEEEKQTNPSKKNLTQDMTIGIIVSVAIFGMTTISIFYILKQQKIIN